MSLRSWEPCFSTKGKHVQPTTQYLLKPCISHVQKLDSQFLLGEMPKPPQVADDAKANRQLDIRPKLLQKCREHELGSKLHFLCHQLTWYSVNIDRWNVACSRKTSPEQCSSHGTFAASERRERAIAGLPHTCPCAHMYPSTMESPARR